MNEIQDVTRPAGTFEWVKEHRRLYLRSGGVKGHIMDITGAGGINDAARALTAPAMHQVTDALAKVGDVERNITMFTRPTHRWPKQ